MGGKDDLPCNIQLLSGGLETERSGSLYKCHVALWGKLEAALRGLACKLVLHTLAHLAANLLSTPARSMSRSSETNARGRSRVITQLSYFAAHRNGPGPCPASTAAAQAIIASSCSSHSSHAMPSSRRQMRLRTAAQPARPEPDVGHQGLSEECN